jgi:presenilin-like A22 family membrane protease
MKHILRVTIILTVLFAISQVIGLVIVDEYRDKVATEATGELQWKALPSIMGVGVERPDIEPKVSIWYIVAAILLGTGLILLIIKIGKTFLWKLWFFLAITVCLQVALAAFVSESVALILALLFAFFKIVRPNVILHNFSELFLYGGLAAIFVPILNVRYAFILLLVLSAYDAYAVWKSKHMIKMAKFQTKTGVFAGLLIPYRYGKKQVKTAVLGGGDIGFPLIFAGTVLKTSGFLPALVVSLFSTIALFGLLWLSKKDRFYPAMPFITAGCIVGYLVSLLV